MSIICTLSLHSSRAQPPASKREQFSQNLKELHRDFKKKVQNMWSCWQYIALFNTFFPPKVTLWFLLLCRLATESNIFGYVSCSSLSCKLFFIKASLVFCRTFFFKSSIYHLLYSLSKPARNSTAPLMSERPHCNSFFTPANSLLQWALFKKIREKDVFLIWFEKISSITLQKKTEQFHLQYSKKSTFTHFFKKIEVDFVFSWCK